MMWLKACPKCRGDMFEDYDGGRTVLACLQCGRSLSPSETDSLRGSLAARARHAVRAVAAAAPPSPLAAEDLDRPTVVE